MTILELELKRKILHKQLAKIEKEIEKLREDNSSDEVRRI
jgi:hypothetical protein